MAGSTGVCAPSLAEFCTLEKIAPPLQNFAPHETNLNLVNSNFYSTVKQ